MAVPEESIVSALHTCILEICSGNVAIRQKYAVTIFNRTAGTSIKLPLSKYSY